METMRTFKKVKIDTKEMRAALKNAGIKTVQMRTNKEGVLICIADIEGNEDKFVSFCKENGLKKGATNDKLFSVGGIKGDFIDYGRLYKYEEVL